MPSPVLTYAQTGTGLRASYAQSGTDLERTVVPGMTAVEMLTAEMPFNDYTNQIAGAYLPTRCPRSRLRIAYAKSGTELWYGASDVPHCTAQSPAEDTRECQRRSLRFPIRLRASYAISGTGLRPVLTYAHSMHCPVPRTGLCDVRLACSCTRALRGVRTGLLAQYAMSGAELAYGACRFPSKVSGDQQGSASGALCSYAPAMRCPRMVLLPYAHRATCLRAYYAMSGTEGAYGATKGAAVLLEHPFVRYRCIPYCALPCYAHAVQ
eukprot:3940551-Rhodomonas_salina.1